MRTQLAVAMASLAAHLPATEWDDIGALQWLATRITGDGSDPSRHLVYLNSSSCSSGSGSYRRGDPERRRSCP